MRVVKRGVFLVLVVLTTVPFIFAGGGGESAETVEQIELNVRFIGPGKQKDSDEVWAAFNARLDQYLPGVSANFEIIPAAEYADRWKLALSAGDQLDVAGRYWVQNLDIEAAKGALLPLNDLIATYGQDIKKNMPSWVLDKGVTAGLIYEIPCYQPLVNMRYAIFMPEELATRYNMNQVSAELAKQEFMTQESWELLMPYFYQAKADNLLRKGIGTPVSWLWAKGMEIVGTAGAASIRMSDTPIRVFNKFDTENFKAAARTMAQAYEDGLIRNDILAMANPRDDDGKVDGTIMWIHTSWGDAAESMRQTTRYGYPVSVQTVSPQFEVGYAHTATNLAIPSTAKYPDQAMQFINFLQSQGGIDLYNMLTWGLEGKHYIVVREGASKRIETIGYAGQGNSDSPYGLWKWAMGNTRFSWLTQSDQDGFVEEWVAMNEAAVPSPLMGWVPDPNPTKTEEAQLQAVIKEFENALLYGALGDDWEPKYEEFLAKLKAAGIDKVVTEYQRQIDAFFAGK